MTKFFGFGYITVKENLRRKSLYGVSLAYILSILFARILADFSLQDLTKFMVDFSYSFLSFFLVVSIIFIATDVMSKDLDKKAVYMILSKGISRESYIIGRSFGFLLFSFIFTFLLGIIFVLFLKILNTTILEMHKKDILLVPSIIVLIVLWVKLFLLSTVILFFSSFMSTFFLVFLASIVVYVTGSSVESLYYFVTFSGDKVSPFVVYTVKFLFYALPNFSSLGSDVMLGTEAIDLKRVIFEFSKAVTYSGFLISSSALLFKRRELP